MGRDWNNEGTDRLELPELWSGEYAYDMSREMKANINKREVDLKNIELLILSIRNLRYTAGISKELKYPETRTPIPQICGTGE
jgi:hypothetical protein